MNPDVVSRMFLASKDICVVLPFNVFLAKNDTNRVVPFMRVGFSDHRTGLQSFAGSHVHGAMKLSLSSEKESGSDTLSPRT